MEKKLERMPETIAGWIGLGTREIEAAGLEHGCLDADLTVVTTAGQTYRVPVLREPKGCCNERGD